MNAARTSATHPLRVDFVDAATTLLERRMPIDQIQKFLGHSKLETTQVYAESTTEMIKESYRRALSV
jgi:site-specific recombinase XerD